MYSNMPPVMWLAGWVLYASPSPTISGVADAHPHPHPIPEQTHYIYIYI